MQSMTERLLQATHNLRDVNATRKNIVQDALGRTLARLVFHKRHKSKVEMRRRHAIHPEATALAIRATAIPVFDRSLAKHTSSRFVVGFLWPIFAGGRGKQARPPLPCKPRSPSESVSEGEAFLAPSGSLTFKPPADGNGLHLRLSLPRPWLFTLKLGGLHATPSARMLLNSLMSFSILASLATNSPLRCSAASSAVCNSFSTRAIEAFCSLVPNEAIGSTSNNDGKEPMLSIFWLV
mmetsp:Transcript_83228/g.209807  ORF Transcript_83228/g.209807 Transcript_83228/m.209807 type:complete len:237 (+) Transcript_83228:332-1042(+)